MSRPISLEGKNITYVVSDDLFISLWVSSFNNFLILDRNGETVQSTSRNSSHVQDRPFLFTQKAWNRKGRILCFRSRWSQMVKLFFNLVIMLIVIQKKTKMVLIILLTTWLVWLITGNSLCTQMGIQMLRGHIMSPST